MDTKLTNTGIWIYKKVNWETTEYLVSILEEMVKGWAKGEGLGKLIY